MTLLERDILAVLLSVNLVFMILALPYLPTPDYSNNVLGLLLTTIGLGLPLGAAGVWWNHRTSR
jgi:hypothetical protein